MDLAVALESNSTLTKLNLRRNQNYPSNSFSLNTDTQIGNEGAVKLSEALKSNTSLTDFDLRCNRLLPQFILTQYSE
jgi:hypothetical protein